MTQEALKLALDALEDFSQKNFYDDGKDEIGSLVCCEVLSYKAHDENCKAIKAITAIKQALAHEQEPVKIVQYNCTCGRTMKFESVHGVVAPQRTWVGLTGEEAMDVTRKEGHELLDFIYEYGTGVEGVEERIVAICKAIESKLKEVNT